jgi:hypothetical protein
VLAVAVAGWGSAASAPRDTGQRRRGRRGSAGRASGCAQRRGGQSRPREDRGRSGTALPRRPRLVRDRPVPTSRHRHREIACIVAGRRSITAVVGAALPREWATLGPRIERAISSLRT